ncbi:MAG: FAD-dependent oxidoreductase [Capsulimonadaceae bacterium]|nr:FAD-dependent oxidoreductase [Capsulimonadaceae bacterium]
MNSSNNKVQASNRLQKGIRREEHQVDVCVIGGGMAGMLAAIASARNGAKTAIVHDRPVFGGNASSEVRMWICGAQGKYDKEAGLLEEIKLENAYRNPALNYSIWDSVLYSKVHFQPGLTAFLNTTCLGAAMDGDRIASIDCWQLNTQTRHTITAKMFIDCSGDSILASLTPAEFRAGREARAEFDEDIEPVVADEKTMGNSLLIQLRRTDEPQLFIPPAWAYQITKPEDLPNRMGRFAGDNFWWIEVGGLGDTIADADRDRDELLKIVYGVVDYIKNYGPEKEAARNWTVEWIGALPGKRENRRYVGDHTLSQNEVRDGGNFEDIVAYGGWPMDDHHPAGIYYPGHPTIFHGAPSPYGIPYRCLYSRNVPNLLFAGRNISVTHAALSSTRVMATCSTLGQAAGTAAALCIRHNTSPRSLSSGPELKELQNTLMDDDAWLPGLTRDASQLARSAKVSGGGGVEKLFDGIERDRENESHAWSGPIGTAIEFDWGKTVPIAGLRIVFDSNLLNDKRMPQSYPQHGSHSRVPASLVRKFRIEARNEGGLWNTVFREDNNYQRLVTPALSLEASALRIIPEETWGDKEVRIYSIDPLEVFEPKIPYVKQGDRFAAARAGIAPADLALPDNGLEPGAKKTSRGA